MCDMQNSASPLVFPFSYDSKHTNAYKYGCMHGRVDVLVVLDECIHILRASKKELPTIMMKNANASK